MVWHSQTLSLSHQVSGGSESDDGEGQGGVQQRQAPQAADLSRGLFSYYRLRLLESHAEFFRKILVLNISQNPVTAYDLERLFEANPLIRKVDACRCGLDSLPDQDIFRGLQHLKVLHLHRNHLKTWEDVQSAAAASQLVWLTAF
ncbi:unnamed protein product, partial [Polarella glacialis]